MYKNSGKIPPKRQGQTLIGHFVCAVGLHAIATMPGTHVTPHHFAERFMDEVLPAPDGEDWRKYRIIEGLRTAAGCTAQGLAASQRGKNPLESLGLLLRMMAAMPDGKSPSADKQRADELSEILLALNMRERIMHEATTMHDTDLLSSLRRMREHSMHTASSAQDGQRSTRTVPEVRVILMDEHEA